MRRKLLAVAQRLGVSSCKATRLAAAASDHAKDVTRNTALELLVGLNGSASTQELCFDFAATHRGTDASLHRGFDRVEPLIEGERRGLACLLPNRPDCRVRCCNLLVPGRDCRAKRRGAGRGVAREQSSPASGEGGGGGSARSAVFVTRRRSSGCLQLPGKRRFRTNLRERQHSRACWDTGPKST